jgi:hypothetical protein
MSEIYGAQFANQYGSVGGESFITWSIGLSDLTPDDIELGFRKTLERENAFVPNLNEFRTLCRKRPEDFGLPSSLDAWREACAHCHEYTTHPWSAKAVFEAGSRIQFFNIKSGQAREKGFAEVYEQVCQEVMQGKVFKGPNSIVDETTLEHHKNGKEVSARQMNKNLATGNATLSGLKGLFR